MSDLKLQIKPKVSTQDEGVFLDYIKFTPNTIVIRITDLDILSKITTVYYELRNTELSNDGYVSRNQVETGSVRLDVTTILGAVDNSNPESPVMQQYVTNQILAKFGLELLSSKPLPI